MVSRSQRTTIPRFSSGSSKRRSRSRIYFCELELDAVVVNYGGFLILLSAAAVRARIPLLVHCHGALLPRAFPRLNMAAWHSLDVLQYYMADMVLTPSRWVGDHLRTVCKVSESRLRVLFNGTELPVLGEQDTDSATTGPPEFVMLCTLEPHKWRELSSLDAAASLPLHPAISSSARFLVYGEGSPRNTANFLRQLIRRRHNSAGPLHPALRSKTSTPFIGVAAGWSLQPSLNRFPWL